MLIFTNYIRFRKTYFARVKFHKFNVLNFLKFDLVPILAKNCEIAKDFL